MKITSLRSVLTPLLSAALLVLWVVPCSSAQQPAAAVPTLVNFRGTLADLNGKPLNGTVGVTFLLYKDQQGGAPLWIETQNVQPDKYGHYSVTLGSIRSEGLPTDLFVSGEARWMGVQPHSQAEQPRVLLLSVPYALKAGDAQTVGGLPASAFVLAAPAAGNVAATENGSAATTATAASAAPPASSNVTTTGGTANTIPMFTTATNIQNSLLSQTGTTAVNVGGKLNLPASGTATATKGFNSRPETMVASAFSSGTSKAVAQTFQLQAEPSNNNTATPSGTLNLLYGLGTSAPTETGLKINNKGQIAFATGQTFPGTGTGTVKSVGLSAPSSDFTVSGSPVTGTGTLGLSWAVAPTSANTPNAIVKRDASGNFTAGAITATTLNAVNASLSNSLGIISGTGTPAYIQSSAGGATGLWAVSTATSGQGWGVYGVTSSGDSGAYGVYGLAPSSTAGAIGVKGYSSSSQGVWGESNGTGFSNGVGSDGVHGVAHSSAGSGVAGINDAKDSTGVYGSDPQGCGFVTDSHVSQARGGGGWVKATAFVNFSTGAISRCFNSQISGSGASTPPCGMTTVAFGAQVFLDFGFEVDDRFVQVTFLNNSTSNLPQRYGLSSDGYSISNTEVEVTDADTTPSNFYVVVY